MTADGTERRREHPRDEGLARRLREAIEAWPRGGITAFQSEMASRDVVGSSYAMVHKYLGGMEPPLTFTRVAAQVLGVRPEWLILGSGSATEAEAGRELAVRRSRLKDSWAEEWTLAAMHALAAEYPVGYDLWDNTTWRDPSSGKFGYVAAVVVSAVRIALWRQGAYPPAERPETFEETAAVIERVKGIGGRLGRLFADARGLLGAEAVPSAEVEWHVVVGICNAVEAADTLLWAVEQSEGTPTTTPETAA